jgi:hypothetical protein
MDNNLNKKIAVDFIKQCTFVAMHRHLLNQARELLKTATTTYKYFRGKDEKERLNKIRSKIHYLKIEYKNAQRGLDYLAGRTTLKVGMKFNVYSSTMTVEI